MFLFFGIIPWIRPEGVKRNLTHKRGFCRGFSQVEEQAAKEASSPLLEAVQSITKVLHKRNVGLMRLLEAAVDHASR
jgi:hypothetical protein